MNSDAQDWTEAFADWLVEDQQFGRNANIRRERMSPGDGAMSGDLVGWISLAVASGSFLADLISVYGNFRGSLPRRERPAVRLIVEHGETRVILEEGTAEDAARVARALNATQEQGQGTTNAASAPGTPPSSSADALRRGEASGVAS